MRPKENLSVKAYRHILAKITKGELKPGDRLTERALASELGCSHLPIREAISKLAQAGWIEQRAGRGAQVRLVDKARIRSLWEFREILELGAVDLIFESGAKNDFSRLIAQEKRLSRNYEQRNAEAYLEHDESFHLELVHLSGNKDLIHTHKLIFTQAVHAYPGFMMGALAITMGDRSKPLREEEAFSHFDITQQLVKGNRDQVRHLLKNHIRNGARYFSQVGEQK